MSDVNVKQIKYLDWSGVEHLWGKISDTFVRKSDIGGDVVGGNLVFEDDKTNHILKLMRDTADGSTEVTTWDYSDFYKEAVKDGILEDVSLVVVGEDGEVTPAGTYLKFTFNTASGKKPIYVNVTDLIDTYTGSEYIAVENGIVSLKATEFVQYLKHEDIYNVNAITSKVSDLEAEVNNLKTSVDSLDLTALQNQVNNNTAKITALEEVVPTVAITADDINTLV